MRQIQYRALRYISFNSTVDPLSPSRWCWIPRNLTEWRWTPNSQVWWWWNPASITGLLNLMSHLAVFFFYLWIWKSLYLQLTGSNVHRKLKVSAKDKKMSPVITTDIKLTVDSTRHSFCRCTSRSASSLFRDTETRSMSSRILLYWSMSSNLTYVFGEKHILAVLLQSSMQT